MANVQAVPPANPLPDEQRWRCRVCGQELAYPQSISLELSALLVGAFGECHEQCVAPKVGGEAP